MKNPTMLTIALATLSAEPALSFVPASHLASTPKCAGQRKVTSSLKMETREVEFVGSEMSEKDLRQSYDQWRKKFRKGGFNRRKFENYKDNYQTLMSVNLSREKEARERGLLPPMPIKLNEYADCSFEEYAYRRTGRKYVPDPPPRADSYAPSQSNNTYSPSVVSADNQGYTNNVRSASPDLRTPSVNRDVYDDPPPPRRNSNALVQRSRPTEYRPRAVEYVKVSKPYDEDQDIEFRLSTPIDDTMLTISWGWVLSLVSYVKSASLGAIVGPLAMLPVSLYHYYEYSDILYTTNAQFEWDLIAAVFQGAFFATVYRYAIRPGINEDTLRRNILLAFIVIKSLVGVQVVPECAGGIDGFPLFCAEPFFVVSEGMAADIAVSIAESIALFGGVSLAMDNAFNRYWIRRYSE